MIIDSHADCIACIVNQSNDLATKYIDDSKERFEFLNEVLKIISETEYNRTAPIITAKIMRLIKRHTATEDLFVEEKRSFNNKMLKLYPKFKAYIEDSSDPIKAALKLSIAGNVIDTGALEEVNDKMIDDVLKKSEDDEISEKLYNQLLDDLEQSEHLLYIGDNAGEIVLDKLLIEQIKDKFKNLIITYSVRGEPIYNDVTKKDARQVGIDDYAKVIDNGTDLPGTDLLEVSKAFLEVFNSSEVIISKGQGNFESLSGCQKNVYYLLLCKCEMLRDKFHKEFLESIFINEKNL